MITRIDNINGFGIYKNFRWNSSNLNDFKAKNIIYGWNYSGKTTLSRVFSSLRDKTLFDGYINSDFKITASAGTYTKANINDFPYSVLVFNSDYVHENLKWEKDDDINAIFFEVGDDAKNSKKVEELNAEIIKINGDDTTKGIKEKYDVDVKTFTVFEDSLFTDESRRIKNDVLSSLIEFDKRNFKKQRDLVIQNVNGFILTKTDVEKLSKMVKIKEPKPELDLIRYQLNLNELITKVNSVLVREPEKQDVISVLEGNLDALEWTKKGLELNEPNTNCLFCDNPISSNRIELLNRFYANEGAKLRNECKPLLEAISKHEEDMSKLNFPPSIQDINEGFQDQYFKQKKRLDRSLKVYQNKLSYVRQQLIDKEHKYVYQSVSEIQEFDCETLEKELTALNDILKSNNDFSSNFQTLINTERLKYINHLVAKFLKDNKYFAKQKKHDQAIIEIEKLDEKVSLYLKEIERLNALKNSGEEGCQQFNYFIQSFLGKEDIEIKFDDAKKKFNLYRGKEIAKHLSEGEKMAISFSHFMVTLKAIETKNQLVNTIIYIDDPISSLDGNHVFQINAMLKDFLYEKVPDPNNGSQQTWNQKCMQLFISTHNYEFFNLLKEMPTTSGYRFSRKPSSKESRYFISRKLNSSEIVDLPKVYNDFKSEYHYLFQQIYEFSEESPSEKVIIMPNVLRRFLEIYTLAKYPSTEEVDDRATEIWNAEISKRICKPFHFFSHFNNIDRIGQHSELLADVNAACKELINQLKKDKTHYKALEATL